MTNVLPPETCQPPRVPQTPGAWRCAACCCILGYSLLLLALWSFLGFEASYPGDEERFIRSSLAFAGWPSVELLRTYEEMSTPLPFWYWGNWAALFGDSLFSMRASTALWGVAASGLLFQVLALLLGDLRRTLIAWLLLVLHPYWWTMSIFAYTDIFGITGLLLAALGVHRGQWLWTAAGIAVALLSRQYLVFALPPLALMALVPHHLAPAAMRRQIFAMAVGILPFAGMLFLWQGLQPQNKTNELYQTGLMSWSLQSCFLYISLIGIYGSVAWLLAGRRRLPIGWEWLCVPLGGLAGWLIPIAPSVPALEGGYTTVGLFDVFMTHILSLPFWLKQLIWTLGIILGMFWLWRVGRAACHTWFLHRRLDSHAFTWLMIGSFLIVMPLSYLHWEKYFLPVLPWVAAGWLLPSPGIQGRA